MSTVLAEVAFGIELLPAGRRRRSLEIWLRERVMSLFAGRILPSERDAPPVFGQLMVAARRQGRPARVGDAKIAVALVDPWQDPRQATPERSLS